MSGNADFKGALLDSPQLKLQKDHYDKIAAAKGDRTLAYKEVLQPHTGDAFFVKAGQVIRVEHRRAITQISDWWWITPDLQIDAAANSLLGVERQPIRAKVQPGLVAVGFDATDGDDGRR